MKSIIIHTKEKLVFGIISILFLNILSCKSDAEPIGKWDDNIKLSKKEVHFTAEPNSVIITTKGTWWWINEIGLNDDWSYDLSEINTFQEFLIENTHFTIERKSPNEIHISMTKNQSNSERILKISLQAGNYFDGIKIIQSQN